MLSAGDRIKLAGTDEDGLPYVRYGFVGPAGAPGHPSQQVVVLLDGELSAEEVPLAQVQLVTVTNVELCLQGDDLVSDPALRRGLLAMWCAEAENAGLALDRLCPLGDGEVNQFGSWLLAYASAGGERYEIRACPHSGNPPLIRLHADPCRLELPGA
jgi:hypothetical protein